MIEKPRFDDKHPNRDIECEEDIERELSDLIERAETAGWSYAEISEAVISLAINYRKKRDELAQTQLAIQATKGRLH